MKKIMYLAAALLVLVGCNKNSQENKENAPANYGTITGTIELPQTPNKIVAPDGWKAMTEAFKMQWESADKIYIYNESECKELTVKEINAQSGNATFEGELLSDMTSYNVAYGYDPTATGVTEFVVPYIANNYRPFAWGTGESYIFTIDNFGPVMGLKLQGTAKVSKIEVIASKSSAAQATYTMTMETAIELNATTPTVVYFPLNDLADADKLEAKFYQGSSVLKTQVFTTLPAKNVVTTYPAIEVNDPTRKMVNGHEAVQLWENGPFWATMNVGATTPEGYGDYFAWGETTTKNDYSWDTYFDTDDGGSTFKKYYNGGGKTILELADDAAAANWKGVWRMPTKAEWDELKTTCTCTGTTLNGIKGYEVEGSNGNTIFLPASGYRYNTSLNDVGSCGRYWSSSLNESYQKYAWSLYFVGLDYFGRYYGQSVRPVCQ